MLSNKFNLITLFGFLMLGVALLCLGIAGQFFYEYYNDDFSTESTDEKLARFAFAGFGIFMVILSIALMLRFRWARIGLIVIFFLAIIGWTILISLTVPRDMHVLPVFIGMSGLVYSALIFGILFLNNQYVLMHFEEKHHRNEEHPELLDQ